jgi:predicted dehydrogenase/nucleoside-diphosphate-sugar epimerase
LRLRILEGDKMESRLTNRANFPSSSLPTRVTRAAIVGTGYIAEFHARAIQTLPDVDLVGVCDANLRRAKSFAAEWAVPTAFGSLQSMLADQRIDVVHVLTPPDRHHSMAKAILHAGANVFLEKPMCTSIRETDELLEIAEARSLLVGVNHNFLFSGAYQILREAIRSGALGLLDYISVDYLYELGPIRLGPFNSWMLQAPENVFLETGPHLVSALLDLVGPPDSISVTTDRKVQLPNGAHVIRRWRVQMTAGRTALDININLGPGFNQRTIFARGLLGSAILDFDANTCIVDRHTPLGADLDRYRRSLSLARQLRRQARHTLTDYALTKLKLRQRGNPYQVSILDSIAAFYTGLRSGESLDSRISGKVGSEVIGWCSRIIQTANIELDSATKPAPRDNVAIKPTVLVIGGSGFIGRELVRQLLEAGYVVRAMTRGSSAALEELQNGRLETIQGDLRNESDLAIAMQGIEFIYDLATSEAKTWDVSLHDIVEPTRQLGGACLTANIKRLIYTGTIDSYYAGARAGVITEQTPLDRNIRRRNYYARAKAAAESVLIDLHRMQKLPVVIVRPGIVIGTGGSAFHWGVGKFSEGVCEVWGDGTNKLPLVLVQDVAAALVRCIQTDGIEGRSYNLIDVPLLSAREYLAELQRLAGIKLTIFHRSILWFYLSDLLKWAVKLAVGHPDRARIPSYRDWESRTQKAIFDCSRAREDLGWAPSSDRQRMINEGIGGSLKSWLEAII